jgi:hypothetical protein
MSRIDSSSGSDAGVQFRKMSKKDLYTFLTQIFQCHTESEEIILACFLNYNFWSFGKFQIASYSMVGSEPGPELERDPHNNIHPEPDLNYLAPHIRTV